MGKTLKRQRQKQLREQQQQQQQQGGRPAKLPRLANGAPLNAGSSSSKFTAAVSAALQDKRWSDAVTILEAMQQFGKVPKLGAVQRWVRDADQAGSLSVTARLLDAILRCTVVPPASSPPPAPAAGPLQGAVIRHTPWLPPAAAAAAGGGGGTVTGAATADTDTAGVDNTPTAAAAADGAATGPKDPDTVSAAAAATCGAAAVPGDPQETQQTGGSESAAAAAASGDQASSQQQQGQIQQQQPSNSGCCQSQNTAAAAAAAAAAGGSLGVDELRSLLYQVPFKSGAGGPDAIYTFPPNTIRFDASHPPPAALPVPFVPGALLLQGVLSTAECKQIIAAAEAIGWHSDVDYTFGGAAGDDGGHQQQQQHAPNAETQQQQQQQQQVPDSSETQQQQAPPDPHTQENPSQTGKQQQCQQQRKDGQQTTQAEETAAAAAGGSAARGLAAGLAGLPEGTPASGCVWLADESVLQPLYERVSHLLPPEIEGGAYAGINTRWRLYRYTPGAVYRPHVDGAWPGSGIDPQTKEYVFDAYGDRWSRLTFLVYLNDGFEGGCTTYYTPSEKQVGVLDARGVVPVAGNVLVFPHGGTKGSLVHEGSAVVKGAKYVIRTDVLYMNPPKAAADGRGKPRAGK